MMKLVFRNYFIGKYCFLLLAVLVFSQQNLVAQEQEPEHESIFLELSQFKTSEGLVHIFQSPELRVLFNDYIDQKKKEEGLNGYRIQIFSSSGHTARKRANETRNDFVSKYPDYSVHILFENPNFKIRVGDFRTKSEALKVLNEIKEVYRGAYLVKDYVKWQE